MSNNTNGLISKLKILSDDVVKSENTIDETSFEKLFLPMFLPDTDDDTINKLNGKWLELTGGYNKSIDIVNNIGDVIFTCPPLLDPDIGFNGNTIKISKITGEYHNTHPALLGAKNNVLNTLTTLLDGTINKDDLTPSKKQWITIVSYFIKKNNKDKTNNPTSPTDVVNDISVSDYNFD